METLEKGIIEKLKKDAFFADYFGKSLKVVKITDCIKHIKEAIHHANTNNVSLEYCTFCGKKSCNGECF